MEEEAEAEATTHADDGDSDEDGEADEAEARFNIVARQRSPPSPQTRREQAAAQVRAIVNHGEYSLHSFRSLGDKKTLLDAASASMNGNAMMTVILFLKDTLSSNNFRALIAAHREASNLYLRHLRDEGNHVDRVLMYHAQGDHRREGLARLALCYQVADVPKRLAAFQDCLQYFQRLHSRLFEFESKQLEDQIKLLEIQINMERVDAARAAKGEPLFVSFPRSPIVYSGLGATLYYSVFYHSYATQGKAKEIAFLPANMRKTFRIGEKRFFWVKLRALCCQKQWAAVKQLPTTALFSSKPTSPIGFGPFVDAIHTFGGPTMLLREFLVLIKSPTKRYRAALRTTQYDIAIDALVATRDEEELLWLLKEIKWKLGPVADIEYRTKIESALTSLRAPPPAKPH